MENKIENISIITALKYFFDEPETLSFDVLNDDVVREKIYVIKENGAIKVFHDLSDFFWYLLKHHVFYKDEIYIVSDVYIEPEIDEKLIITNDDCQYLSDTLSTYYYISKNAIKEFAKNAIKEFQKLD